MSTPRFKKDKEIIAEYESQVKGKGESLQMCLSRNITNWGQANIGVHHNLSIFFRKLENRDPSVVHNKVNNHISAWNSNINTHWIYDIPHRSSAVTFYLFVFFIFNTKILVINYWRGFV